MQTLGIGRKKNVFKGINLRIIISYIKLDNAKVNEEKYIILLTTNKNIIYEPLAIKKYFTGKLLLIYFDKI